MQAPVAGPFWAPGMNRNPEPSFSDAAALPTSASFLLCRPDHFTVEYAINPFMSTDVPVDSSAAHAEWQAYRERLEGAGAVVLEQPPIPGFPDIVFTNNAALVQGKRALLARFKHEQRKPETGYNRHTLMELGYAVESLPESAGAFEGAADAFAFRGRLLCASGQRSAAQAIPHLERFSGIPALEVQLEDERLYHLDLAVCPLDEQTAMIAAWGMSPVSSRELLELVPDPILLTEAETLAFCANSVVVGRTVFMHAAPERVRAELEGRGFTVVEQPVTEFTKSGGSLRCMSLRLT